MAQISLLWHDYETFGADPKTDRPVQFAGVRTDADFSVIDDPVLVYCKPTPDYLPHPEACLITGITPQKAEQAGLCEAEFFNQIHQQLAHPQTCTLGYNSIRFDDEVTRYGLYRNFFDPYAREWQNGNSRWDLIDVLRAARALRPEGIQWPDDNEGRPCFRLELLTKANGISHEGAHDALADVYATIGMAKLLKTAQPKLYDFLWRHRVKARAAELLQLGSFNALVHVSGKYPAHRHCLAIVLPLCRHPDNPNGVIVYDLSVNPEPLLALSADAIKERIFTPVRDLPEGIERIPLKTVHINKCPVLAPLSVIRPHDSERLGIDLTQCRAHLELIKSGMDLSAKIAEVFRNESQETDNDPDLALYSGGFFSDEDRQKMTQLRALSPEQLAHSEFRFNDVRLPEMLFRYRARNYPDTLTEEENQRWQRFCQDKLTGKQPGAGILLADYQTILAQLKNQHPDKSALLDDLGNYADKLRQTLAI